MTVGATTSTVASPMTVTVGAMIVTPSGWMAIDDNASMTFNVMPSMFITIWLIIPSGRR